MVNKALSRRFQTNMIIKHIIKGNLLTVASTLILLTVSGCDKSESIPVNPSITQQIQNIQENTSAEDNTQSQPIQDNANPKGEQTTESTDNSIPTEPVHVTPQEAQQDNPQNKELDWNDPEHFNTIDIETQKAYANLKSLSSALVSCHRNAQTECNNKGQRAYRQTELSYSLEYDEYGYIYYIEDTFSRNYKKWDGCEPVYDSCFRKTLPKSFKFDLSDIVKNYPDNVQRFGRIKLVFNTNTNQVSIIDAYSKPIGTIHQNIVGNYGEPFNKHYEKWLRRRGK